MPDTHTPSPDTTFLAKAFSGGVAGCIETSITMPFETTKTVQQLKHNPASMLRTATSIYHTKGIRGFYYGLPACLVQASGKVAVRFSCYGFYHNLFTTNTTGEYKNSSVLKGMAGVCAGATESCWITPCERLKTLRVTQLNVPKQQEQFTSLWHTLRQLKSPSNVYVGFLPTAIRNGLAVGGRFFLYDQCKDALQTVADDIYDDTYDGWWHSLACGFFVGIATTLLSQPADVIKSKMQGAVKNKNNGGGSSQYVFQSSWQCTTNIFQKEGVRGIMTKGLSARLLKIGCGQAVIFSIYEHVNQLFAKTV